MVSVAVRWVAPVLADAANATLPAPLPLAPELTVSHVALLVAVHVHPVRPVTATDPVAAAAVSAWVVAEIV
jgi:hypothetical protein